MSRIITTARATDPESVLRILQDQRARQHDIVTTGSKLRFSGGKLVVEGDVQAMDESGVTTTDGVYDVGQVFTDGMGGRLDLPVRFLNKLADQGRTDMIDGLVNARLWGSQDYEVSEDGVTGTGPDPRKHLLRLLRGDPDEAGYARAWLSPKFRFLDALDLLMAILTGIREAGVNAVPTVCDLTERNFYMRVEAPEIMTAAPNLLAGYHSPFGGRGRRARAGDADATREWVMARNAGLWDRMHEIAAERGIQVGDVVSVGLEAGTSDVGGGAKFLRPQIEVLSCLNGMTYKGAGTREIHLGSEMEEGLIDWSEDTRRRELELITAQTTDAVKGILTQDFLETQVAEIEAVAGAPVHRNATVTEIVKAHGFSGEQADEILDMFREVGPRTAGNLANAATAWAQVQDDADLARKAEAEAVPMMNAAAARVAR